MGKIVISTNISLDGVVQDPDGEEGFRLGGWFGQFGGKDLEAWAKVEFAEALGTEALLLGRRSDEWFGARWSSRGGEWADRLNSLPKYVVSSTLVDPHWTNSTVLKGDVVTEVSKLKHELDGEIVVYASYQLGRTLIDHDLVDELRLVVFPVVLGAGERLFGETSDKKPLRLSAPGPSVMASPPSPTRSSGTPSGASAAVGSTPEVSGDRGDDLGGQAFHVLGLVEERGEQDQVGAGFGHVAGSTYAVLRRPGDGDRRQGLAELAIEVDQGGGDALSRPLAIVVDGDVDALGDPEGGRILRGPRRARGARPAPARRTPRSSSTRRRRSRRRSPTARRRAAGRLAPNQIGGCGFWNGLGSMVALVELPEAPGEGDRGTRSRAPSSAPGPR